jgi:hypothetical protein
VDILGLLLGAYRNYYSGCWRSNGRRALILVHALQVHSYRERLAR